MIDQANANRTWAPILRSLDRQHVCDRMNECINWPAETHVTAVKVRRFLPGRRQRFDIEYELLVQGRINGREHLQRTALFARRDGGDFGSATHTDTTDAPDVSDGGISRVYAVDEDFGFTFHSADCDPSLSQYRQCVDGDWMIERFMELGLIPRQPRAISGANSLRLDCERVAFRLGRRFVIRYALTGGQNDVQWAGKCYADHRGERLADLHRQLYEQLMSITGGRVCLPRLIHYDGDLKMVLSVWKGTGQDPAEQRPGELARWAAESLVAIQATSPSGLEEVDPSDRWQTLERWNTCIRQLLPELWPPADDLMGALSVAYAGLSAPDPVVIHRDFYESQLLTGHDGAIVLDLDTLAIGDRAVDVGNFLAHQWLWCLERGLGFDRYQTIAETFLETYEKRTSPLGDRTLSYEWASSLFRIGAIHAFRDITSRYTCALWDLVQPVLKHGRRVLASSEMSMPRIAESHPHFSEKAGKP